MFEKVETTAFAFQTVAVPSEPISEKNLNRLSVCGHDDFL